MAQLFFRENNLKISLNWQAFEFHFNDFRSFMFDLAYGLLKFVRFCCQQMTFCANNIRDQSWAFFISSVVYKKYEALSNWFSLFYRRNGCTTTDIWRAFEGNRGVLWKIVQIEAEHRSMCSRPCQYNWWTYWLLRWICVAYGEYSAIFLHHSNFTKAFFN